MKTYPKICLVDDDNIFRFTFSRTLKNLEKESPLMFGDGAEAIAYINNHSTDEELLPDVIFLDINMPIMDGWQFLDEFTQIKSDLCKPITIKMLSSSVDPADIEQATKRPEVSQYIVKPFTPDGMKSLFISL